MTEPANTFHPPSDAAADVTTLLQLAAGGDRDAHDRLYRAVYDELRTLARSYLRSERDNTMPATALVHEAWLRLSNQRSPAQNRGQFFGLAAQAMRRIMVDDARARRTAKRSGTVITLDDAPATESERLDLLIAVDDAVHELAKIAPRQAQVVELRWFADLEVEEVAESLGISAATVKREWRAARAWLHRALANSSEHHDPPPPPATRG
jgi:RNA polymerase sigma-70 factor, ECF subfamily